MDRPKLVKTLDSKTFLEYYYLKEELVLFCKENKINHVGSKIELTNRIKLFLDTGKIIGEKKEVIKHKKIEEITLDTLIEENIKCSELHRAFYKEYIGKSFSFNIEFQKWLKNNSGKTYKDSIDAYYKILEEKKNKKKEIDSQFEYNKYIRDFFIDNKDKTLDDAIKCWKYKKSLKGTNKYEKKDLEVLK